MFRTFAHWLAGLLLKQGKKNRPIILAILLTILAPVLLVAALSFIKTHRDLTEFTLARRQALAYLAASTLKANLDRLTDVGISLATRVRFRQLIREGKWEEAVHILRRVPSDFPFVDRVILTDRHGTLMADTPEVPNVKGKNFSFRDWYQGASQTGEPYVSEVYKRAAKPQYNLVGVAIPMKTEDQTVIGILLLQVKLDVFLQWIKKIDVGPSGFVFVVDRRGRIAAHPGFSAQGEIIDFSKVPLVQKVRRGERGVEIAFNPIEREERISAYEPVPGYGWGVVATQPTATAFAERSNHLRRLLIVYGLIALLSCSLTYLILLTVAEHRQMAENLREREELTHSILDTAYDAFIAIDAAGLIIDWNRQAEVIFGWAHDEIIGKPLVETVIPPKHREGHKRGLHHFLASGEGPVLNKRIELAALRRNGEEFPVEITIWPLRVGQTHRFNALLHDITEHKKTEQEMKRYRERLESANKELEAFSYSVSHDLRAPLRAIDGFSRILMEDYLPQLAPESHRYLRRVRENAQQMGHLIDDLLNFSRLSRHPLRLQPVKPSDLFRQALQDLRQEQDGRRVDIAIGDLPQCRADPVLLKQVFVNLLSNALKFTRQREFSRIEVGWRDANGNPVYFVKDNGAGFDMRYGDKLFGVFQRFHKAEEYEGTGVGLAIAQRVIQRHGGSIWAEARVNQGATFFFTLKGGRPHE